MLAGLPHLDWLLLLCGTWFVIGALGIVALRRFGFVSQVLFPLGGLVCLGVFLVALSAIFAPTETAVLPLGLPGLPFHVRLDALSALFIAVIGGAGARGAILFPPELRKGGGTPPGRPRLG